MGMVLMSVRKAVPEPLRQFGRRISVEVGRRTAGLRPTPDFIMIGAQRAGTTSLFRALMQHPDVARPTFHKGVNYFDVNYHQGMDWYRAHFPLRARARSGRPQVFEASGYYMYHPFAIERVAKALPDIKLVAMLRDPVERAYSAWKHEKARGFEWEDFPTALQLEDERLVGEVERIAADPAYESFSHRHHSYRHRGDYLGQLERVVDLLGRDRLHVLYSEDFFSDPAVEFARLADFLGLAHANDIAFGHYNARPSTSMPEGPRRELTEHYEQERSDLAKLVGRVPSWGL